MTLHTKLSTWIAVVSVILTAFVTLPTFHNMVLVAANIGVLALLIWVAHQEGRSAHKKEIKNADNIG
jgi:hypothetical protein